MAKIIVSVFFGLIVSIPIILYHILFFLTPAIKSNITKVRVIIFILFSFFLFVLGLVFGYYVLIPLSISFFKSISFSLLEYVSLNYTLENYLVYLIWGLIISSIVYQLPILIIFLVQIGLADINWLKSNRRYVIVGFFILSLKQANQSN